MGAHTYVPMVTVAAGFRLAHHSVLIYFFISYMIRRVMEIPAWDATTAGLGQLVYGKRKHCYQC